jgi:hypothetical protein
VAEVVEADLPDLADREELYTPLVGEGRMQPDSRVTRLVALVAALSAVGCGWATISAPGTRVPVLLGPVACIGCDPRPADPAARPALPHRSSRRELVMFVGHGSWEEGTPIAVQTEYAGLDPCTEDLHLSELRAHTWSLDIPPFVFLSDFSIEARTTRSPVPRNECLP